MKPFRGLRSAVSYFTVAPVGAAEVPGAAAVAWLPLVGVTVGGAAGLAGAAVARTGAAPLGAAVAFGAGILASGAIHVDGFLDGCDALFAPVSPRRRHEILKDPHHGSFATAGFAVVAAVQLGALRSISPGRYPAVAASAGGLSRAIAAIAYLRAPERRHDADAQATVTLVATTLAALGVTLARPPRRAAGSPTAAKRGELAAIAASSLLGWSCIRLIRRRLDGAVPGDGYGFTIVVCETTALAVLACAGRR